MSIQRLLLTTDAYQNNQDNSNKLLEEKNVIKW